MDAELGTAGRGRAASPGGVEPYGLAAPVRGGEATSDQRAPQLPRGVRPGHVGVGVVDIHDAPVQGPVSDQAAGGLNLGKLWHPPVLPARGARRITSTAPRRPCRPDGVSGRCVGWLGRGLACGRGTWNSRRVALATVIYPGRAGGPGGVDGLGCTGGCVVPDAAC